MNKQTVITILLAIVAMAGQGQVHYRLEGNIGNSDISDRMEVRDNFNNVLIDSIHVVNGKIEPIEGLSRITLFAIFGVIRDLLSILYS